MSRDMSSRVRTAKRRTRSLQRRANSVKSAIRKTSPVRRSMVIERRKMGGKRSR